MNLADLVPDIAGTTVQEHGPVYRALAETAGWAPTKYEAISAVLGRSDVDAEFADFHVRLRKLYADTPPTPLPGIPEALAQLRSSGVKVALTTGFDRAVVDGLLDVLGWGEGVPASSPACSPAAGPRRSWPPPPTPTCSPASPPPRRADS